MPRLGSVLGSILAELGRARVIADHLSRDLVGEYRDDPILASMSVPRVLLDRAELTLRFAVSDLVEADLKAPVAGNVSAEWARHVAANVVPAVLDSHGLSDAERKVAVARLVGSRDAPRISVPAATIGEAIAGNVASSATATTAAVLNTWGALPREVRTKIGTKAEFRRELEGRLAQEAASFVGRAADAELVKAALASRLDVGIRTDDLASQPEHIQELKITLRGEDVALIIQPGSEQ